MSGQVLRLPRVLLAGLLCTAPFSTVVAAACQSEEHRQFDFWLGDWDVIQPDGKVAGTNSIRREHAGCVLHERYQTAGGYSGASLNTYDAGRKLWHQTWVDSSGTLLLLEGGLQGRDMVLEGSSTGVDGRVTRHRITWTPNPDGTVRQHWQRADAGEAWVTVFDGLYRRTGQQTS